MTKQEMIDLINQFKDNEEFTFPAFWVRSDVELDGEPLTDEQWRKFAHWYEKYADASADYNEAIYYAQKADN